MDSNRPMTRARKAAKKRSALSDISNKKTGVRSQKPLKQRRPNPVAETVAVEEASEDVTTAPVVEAVPPVAVSVAVEEEKTAGEDSAEEAVATVSPVDPPVAAVAPVAPVIKDIDQHSDSKQCASLTEYVSDVFSYLRELEVAHRVSPTYMTETQLDVNPTMRSILVDWLVEVAEEYRLLPETLYICVSYIDRCLTAFPVARSKLQLLGCACMLLASKYEEIYAPPIDEFVYISDNTYTRDDILKMETLVLNQMRFRLAAATPKQFLRRFTNAAESKPVEVDLVNYLAELTLQEYTFVKYRPSHVAAASVLAARMTLGVTEPWTPTLEHYTQYSAKELMAAVFELCTVHRDAKASSLRAVYDKYSNECLNFVATKVKPLDADAVTALAASLTET